MMKEKMKFSHNRLTGKKMGKTKNTGGKAGRVRRRKRRSRGAPRASKGSLFPTAPESPPLIPNAWHVRAYAHAHIHTQCTESTRRYRVMVHNHTSSLSLPPSHDSPCSTFKLTPPSPPIPFPTSLSLSSVHAGTHPHQQIAPPAVANVPLLAGLIYLMQRRARARPLRSNAAAERLPAPLSPLCASLAALWPPSPPLLKGSRSFLRGAPAITGLGGASHPGRMKTAFFTFLSFFFSPSLSLRAASTFATAAPSPA